jgi:hypothetical protein
MGDSETGLTLLVRGGFRHQAVATSNFQPRRRSSNRTSMHESLESKDPGDMTQ